MDRTLIKDFWNCGDNQYIEFAVHRARLNRNEKKVIHLILDECMTQERAAEVLDVSTRQVQCLWYNATDKLLKIPWVVAYAKELRRTPKG